MQLRDYLAGNYDDFAKRLTRHLGSVDLAYDALQETFLRLDQARDISGIARPKQYIFRVAVNIARDFWKAQKYRVTPAEVDAILDMADETPGPARVVEARSEIEAFKRALAELPVRRREVLRRIALEGQLVEDVAMDLRVSSRTVESDLKAALAHCASRLGREFVARSGPRSK